MGYFRPGGLPQNTGFTLEVFPKGEEGGTLVNLGQGGQTLTYSDLRFTYTVRTATGTFSVTSAAIFPSRWHQVSARYHNGKLELWVNQTRYEQAATGAVVYNWTGNASGNDNAGANHDLEIAGEFSGYLDNLKWYNWSSSPVVTFAGGLTETTVTVDATKKATLNLMSTGKLHEHGGVLGLHRVAVHTDKVHQYVSLVSLDNYKVIAGMYSETRPLSEQVVQLPMGFIFPSAHAGAGDTAMSILSFFFPVQELGIVFQQLAYAVTDPDKFEGDTFIVNLIVAATYLPPGRVLQPFAKSLGILFKTLKGINPKFLKYFGGMFSGIISKAKKGDFDTLWHMIPFFIVLAEMYNDDEARKGLEFMFQTVDSGEDILSWVDYLALPAEGWDGDGVPEVGLLLNNTEQQLPLSWMMNQAYAAPKLKRINGVALGKSLLAGMKKISRDQFEHVPDAINIVTKAIKSGDAAALRKYIFNPSIIVGATGLAVRRGTNAVQTFLKGQTNARFSPVIVLATVAYLEWEISCGNQLESGAAGSDNLECNSIGLKGEKTRKEIGNLYRRAFADSLNGKFEDTPDDDDDLEYLLKPYGHGALYHLSQIAYYQLLHRAGGSPIKEVEGSRWVWMYKDKEAAKELVSETSLERAKQSGTFVYRRSVDIVIGAEGEPEQWIELKSYKALSDNGSGRKKIAVLGGEDIGQWSGGNGASKGKFSLHKQFSTDRAAAHAKKVRIFNAKGTYDLVDVAPKFKWRFQKFKVKPKGSSVVDINPDLGAQREKGSIFYGLTQELTGSAKTRKDLKDANFDTQEINGNLHIEYASVSSLVSSLAAIGFKEVADAVIEE
jgi:hypothetical protein